MTKKKEVKDEYSDNEDMEMEHADAEMDDEEHEEEQIDEKDKKAYIPGVSADMKNDEELEFDPNAYKLFHTFETTRPCLSFDVCRDGLGDGRTTFPVDCYMVAGTQGETPKNNEIMVMGLKNLTGMKEENSDSESDDEEDENDIASRPKMHAVSIPHHGGVNRIRAQRLGNSSVCAVWNDLKRVSIWNITGALNQAAAMEGESQTEKLLNEHPLFTFQGHRAEGYAMAWSPRTTGQMATGGNDKLIFTWQMHEGGQWAVSQKPFNAHASSVEDVAWSPTEDGLLASCGADGTIKMWDVRAAPKEACVCTVDKAHDSDVNVISWNANDALLVSGGDDAMLKIWSLKTIQYGQPVARFKHHTGPITSVEWHPQETTTLMASGEDDQVTMWDIATEADDGAEQVEGVPPQLMFLHLGQKEVKEVHWHPQVPGLAMTTAITGFNVFKTINI